MDEKSTFCEKIKKDLEEDRRKVESHTKMAIDSINDGNLDNAMKHLSEAIYWNGARKRLDWLAFDLRCNPVVFRQLRRAEYLKEEKKE